MGDFALPFWERMFKLSDASSHDNGDVHESLGPQRFNF